MRVLIIEDEPIATKRLCKFIDRYDESINVVAKLKSIKNTHQWFEQNSPPDLIFSDIELLDGNVFNFLEEKEINYPIIFTTAYDQFLLKAFEQNGIAYLLKPFTYESFVGAMQKLEKLRSNFVSNQINFWQEMQKTFNQNEYKKRLVVKFRGGIQFVETKKIAYFQMQDGILFAFDKTGKKSPISESLNNLEEVLNPKLFFRINRSEMINLTFIERLEPYFKNRLVIYLKSSSTKFISSSNRTPKLRNWISNDL